MKKTIVAALLCLAAVSAGAQAAFTTIGQQSCGIWVEQRAKKNEVAEFWMTGALSGIAMATEDDFLAQTDAPSIMLWVDKYCREYPLSNLRDAAWVLYHGLKRPTPKKAPPK